MKVVFLARHMTWSVLKSALRYEEDELCAQVNPGQHVKGVHEVIPLQALKQIAERLPQTDEELKRWRDFVSEFSKESKVRII